MKFIVRILTICIAVTVALVTSASAENTRTSLASKKQFLQKQQLIREHVSRVDQTRLRTIDIGLDRLSRDIENGNASRAVFQGLASVETSLYGLRLSPDTVRERIDRVACLRAAVQQGLRQVNCGGAKTSFAKAKPVPKATGQKVKISRIAHQSVSAGARLGLDDRAPFVIGIYGPSVDLELGRFFAQLAERDPSLLQPIPIDLGYQLSACLSGAAPGLVHADLDAAEPAFLNMLDQASEASRTANNLWRFTLSQSDLKQVSARAGLPVPASLEDFTVEDAARLITADFQRRFNVGQFEPGLVAALRNLWIAQGDEGFLRIMRRMTGGKISNEREVGAALSNIPRSASSVWATIYRDATLELHCRDANKVFEAYGLVYKNGDYPSTRQVLGVLRDKVGFPAVPGVSVSHTKHVFLEAKPQTCAAFGPIEHLKGGTSADECNLRKIDVDGQIRWEVLAGGVAIQFFVTPEQRRDILTVMRAFAREPRNGDILRWRSTSRVPVKTQTSEVMVMPHEPDKLENELPCIVSMSRTGSFNGTEGLRGHVDNYRKHFYPLDRLQSPDALSHVFVLDEFDGHTETGFRRQWTDTIQGLTQTYKNAASWLVEPDGTTNQVGQTHLQDSVLLPVCAALADQIRVISADRDVYHGAFVKSLLVGAKSPLTDGMGLLNPQGDFDEQDFAARMEFWATEGDLNLVVQNMIEARDMIPPDVAEGLGPTIFNLSLGASYRFADENETENARQLIAEMKTVMARWNDALFVVAAGQPDGNPDRGLNLKRVSAQTVDVDDADCPFFPACLSTRSNVITVGAVQPSPSGLAHERPVLIPWSNYGSAVSVAAPGAGVMSKEFGLIQTDGDQIDTLPATTVRDGTSVATVFVTALAARMASKHPEMSAPEIKRRLISTARPYTKPDGDGTEVLFEGSEGQLYSGVIDPVAARLDPTKFHVRWKKPREGAPKLEEFQTLLGPSETTPLTVFTSERPRGRAELKCRWADIYRIHIRKNIGSAQEPLFKGGVACKNEVRGELIEVGFGPLGTRVSQQQHPCLLDGSCFKGLTANGDLVNVDLADVRDIYFPVVGR